MIRLGDTQVDRMRAVFRVDTDGALAAIFGLHKVAISHWRARGVTPKYDAFWVGDYSLDARLCDFAMHHGVTEALRIAQRMGAPSLSLDAAKAILSRAVNAGGAA